MESANDSAVLSKAIEEAQLRLNGINRESEGATSDTQSRDEAVEALLAALANRYEE